MAPTGIYFNKKTLKNRILYKFCYKDPGFTGETWNPDDPNNTVTATTELATTTTRSNPCVCVPMMPCRYFVWKFLNNFF